MLDQLDRPAPAAPPRDDVAPDLVLVGGVPGAGKSTVLRRLRRRPGIRVLDPDGHRDTLRRRVGGVVPYRVYRPVVHTLHALDVLTALVRGPRRDGGVLVVHEPGTRPRRTSALLRLARARGWRPAMVFVDASRDAALAGQRERGRVLGTRSFDGHWERWSRQRRRWLEAERDGDGFAVRVVRRHDAEQRLVALLRGR